MRDPATGELLINKAYLLNHLLQGGFRFKSSENVEYSVLFFGDFSWKIPAVDYTLEDLFTLLNRFYYHRGVMGYLACDVWNPKAKPFNMDKVAKNIIDNDSQLTSDNIAKQQGESKE